MKVVAYVCVSTLEQSQKGYGLDIQRAAIRSWAKAAGHQVVSVFTDAGVSGALAADERPGLTEALTALRMHKAAGLVIRDLDRLARSVTVQEAVLLEVWRREGASVFTVYGEVLRDDSDDPMRTAMRQVAGVFAELDRRLIVKRLRDGRKAKTKAGGHANGRYPYGEGPLGPIPAEQAALTTMIALRDDGASTYTIAAALTAGGHPTKRGGRWSSASVSRILNRAKATA
jgi:DNA invertase Pin-like site-specific DNA recombinase